MKLCYDWPVRQKRVAIDDNPEILLISLLAVAAMLCFPFESVHRANDKLPELDWRAWRHIMESGRDSGTEDRISKSNYSSITTEQLTAMSSEELDQYFRTVADDFENKGKRALNCSWLLF